MCATVRGYRPDTTSFMLPVGESVELSVSFSSEGETWARFELDGEERVSTTLNPATVDFTARVPPQAAGEYEARVVLEGRKAAEEGAPETGEDADEDHGGDDSAVAEPVVIGDVTWTITVADPESLRADDLDRLTDMVFDVLTLYTEGCVHRDVYDRMRPYLDDLPGDVRAELTTVYDFVSDDGE